MVWKAKAFLWGLADGVFKQAMESPCRGLRKVPTCSIAARCMRGVWGFPQLGVVLVGHSVNPVGNQEAWWVVLPPSIPGQKMAGLFGLGLLGRHIPTRCRTGIESVRQVESFADTATLL